MYKFTSKVISFFIILFLFFTIEKTFAATNTWNFDLSTDYTLSNSSSFLFTGSIANLEQNTLIHNGKINNATTYNGAYDVVVDGNYAYMTSYLGDRVTILDISNPANPTLISQIVNNNGTLKLDGAAGIVKEGNYLYVASQVSDALQIINVANPAAPTAAGQLRNTTTLNGARGIVKSGNYIYLTCDIYDALQVINVSNISSPSITGTYRNTTNMNGARDIKISGNYAYIANFVDDSLAIINITNPSSPTYVSKLKQTTRLNGAHQVEISGNYAYVSAYLNNSVMVINITNPSTPTETTNISGGSYNLKNPRDLLIDGNKLFITSYGNDAVNVADITNPTSPVYVTKILHNSANPLLDGADGIFKVGNYIYIASYISYALEILKFNYDTTSPYLIPNTGFNYGTLNNIVSVSNNLGTTNAGTITYQISKDNGTTWYYWNGNSWISTTSGVVNSNSISRINSNLSSFNSLSGGTGIFKFKAFFTSNGDQKVELDSFTINTSDPELPAGVSGVSVWLKANKGTSTTTDGASLNTWNDWSGNGYNLTTATAPIYIKNDSANLNFNPIVDFNGVDQYMENTANGASSKSYFVVVVPDSTINGTISGQVPFSLLCEDGLLNTGTCGLPFAGITLGAFTVTINDEVITHAIGSSTHWRSSQIGTASYETNKPMLIFSNENTNGDGTDIYEKGLKINNYSTNTYQFLSGADFRLGMSMDSNNPFKYNGKIAEVINFSNRLNDTDRQKIESYLAIKYGITLNDGAVNYLNSSGNTIWNTTNAGMYKNDIFGIGRDDISGLGQVKSKSINSDNIITMEAIGEGANMSNSFVDISDLEFLSIANDSGANTWKTSDSPSGYNNLSRYWKVQEIGEVGTVKISFDVANTNFDIPVVNAGNDYYFTYDSDNDGVLADESPIAMTNPSSNIWEISSIDLDNGQIFTITSEASTNHIPIDISLSNNSIAENVANGTNVGSLSTSDTDTSDTHTYSFVSGAGDTDNSKFSIVGNTLSINNSPDYELKNIYNIRIQTNDGHGGIFQKEFSINITNIGEAINSIIDFEDLADEEKYTVTSGTWTRTTTRPQEGSYSIESGNTAINSQSCFQVTNTFSSTGTLSFYYNTSSEANDYMRFYIDNTEFQSTSGETPWTNYLKNDLSSGTHTYKWCYIKDRRTNGGSDKAWIDYITFNESGESSPPNITSINYASGTLLSGGNHNLIINYNDNESGINTSSDIIQLYKWNGSSWGSNIAATGLNLGSKIVNTTNAIYPTNNLSFGKYMYNFSISDNIGNTSSTGAVFYIDEVEMIVSTGSVNIGTLSSTGNTFSPEITITVKTIGASFDLILNKQTSLTYNTRQINDWNGTNGFGYDKEIYTNSINLIGIDQIIKSESQNINTNGIQNTYTYKVKLGAKVGAEQAAGNYLGDVKFGIKFNY